MFEGVSLGIAVLPVSKTRWWAEVAFVISQPQDSDVIPTGSDVVAGKNRESMKILEFSGPILVTSDAPAVLRLPGFTKKESITLTLNITASPQKAIFEAGRFLAVDVPTLAVDPGMEAFMGSLKEELSWASPSGMMVVEAEGGKMIADELLQAAGEAPPIALKVAIQQIGMNTEHEFLEIPGLAGRDYNIAVGEAFDCLVDWEAEVAQESRISQPVFSRQFSGVRGTLNAAVIAGEFSGSLLDLKFTAVEMREAATLRLGGEIRFEGDPQQKMDGIQVQCERPAISTANFHWQGDLAEVVICKNLPMELGLGSDVSLRFYAQLLAKR
jgi:hypothetical protein